MVFNTLTFFVFCGIVVTLHSLPFAWTTRKINLLIASYVFHAARNPPFILLLWISTVVEDAALYRIIEADHPPPGDGRW